MDWKEKKAQVAGRIIIGLLLTFIGFVVFVAGYPAWKSVVNTFVSSSTNLGLNILVSFMAIFAFGMFVIKFYSIFSGGGGE